PQGFGRYARALHNVMDYLPGRFAGLRWVGAAYFLAGAEPAKAARALWDKGAQLADAQSFSLLAAAEVLNVSLGGPMSAYGDRQWHGRGSPRAQTSDLARALYLFCLLHLFLFIGFGLFV
ncbi:MAG: hypothetical protein K2Q01_12405, partial [Rickettsiales bacterium]|nr:hypothetical protein [Rickettsiales bacterium]